MKRIRSHQGQPLRALAASSHPSNPMGNLHVSRISHQQSLTDDKLLQDEHSGYSSFIENQQVQDQVHRG